MNSYQIQKMELEKLLDAIGWLWDQGLSLELDLIIVGLEACHERS